MKWDCDAGGRRRRARFLAKQEWHKWFAWHPVKVRSGDCRWLETVERRLYVVDGPWHYLKEWHYRLTGSDGESL